MKHELEEVLSELSEMLEGELREELQHIERTPDIKKDIKMAMAACDAILSQFDHICNVRSAHMGKLFSEFEALLDL